MSLIPQKPHNDRLPTSWDKALVVDSLLVTAKDLCVSVYISVRVIKLHIPLKKLCKNIGIRWSRI